MAFIKSQNRGFTIIDLMISVSVVGFMAVIAIPSFQEYVMTSKIAESYQIITALQNAEKSYFIENNEFRWMGTQPFLLDDDMNEVTYSLANNELGNPLAEGSYYRFGYVVVSGETDSDGNQIVDMAGDGSTRNWKWGQNSLIVPWLAEGGSRACRAFSINSLVNAEGNPNYHWAAIMASSNLYDVGEKHEGCTTSLMLLTYQNGGFSSSPIIVDRESFQPIPVAVTPPKDTTSSTGSSSDSSSSSSSSSSSDSGSSGSTKDATTGDASSSGSTKDATTGDASSSGSTKDATTGSSTK
ncbi:MAG: hypothetical protein KDD46_05355 [Bdellovibrionales bacterium]|nr:hypothetical protein [Bdellovibrionales bacterium]